MLCVYAAGRIVEMKKYLVFILKSLYKFKSPFVRRRLISIIGKLEGGQAFSFTIRELMNQYHGISIGIGTYGPCFNLDQTWVGNGNLVVGKYTSIAKGVCIYSRNHPYMNLSTSPIFYSANMSRGKLKNDLIPYGKLTIGNDVWIGQYAVILPSVHYIGDGAVIGAGSIVTKDVPDYAIVAGNPGKILKYRFDDETINRLKELKWWDRPLDELMNRIEDFKNIDIFMLNRDGE
jgi:acetyltransferase-like isoleucine patch superfamily enzyme